MSSPNFHTNSLYFLNHSSPYKLSYYAWVTCGCKSDVERLRQNRERCTEMEIQLHRQDVGKEKGRNEKLTERAELCIELEPLQHISWLNSTLWLQWSRIEKPDQWDQFFTIYGPSSPLVVACLTLQIFLKARALPLVCIIRRLSTNRHHVESKICKVPHARREVCEKTCCQSYCW